MNITTFFLLFYATQRVFGVKNTHENGHFGTKKLQINYTKSGREKREIAEPRVLSQCYKMIEEYNTQINTIDVDCMAVSEIVSYLRGDVPKKLSFTEYAHSCINDLINANRESSAGNYKIAVRNLHTFINRKNILFSELSVSVLQSWISSLSDGRRKKSLYPTIIKTIFNKAILEYNDEFKGVIRIKGNPFKKIKIPREEQTAKRSVEIEVIRQFFNQQAKGQEELAQDVCQMVFCLAGMNVADLYDLPLSALKNGKICYSRKKTRYKSLTGAYTEITIPEEIAHLFNKYKGEKRLLCFSERYARAQDFSSKVGKAMKRIVERSEINEEITPYSFRHSWATIAVNNCNASIDDVAFALNHASAHKITAIYIRPDYSRIDRLNERVIKEVFGERKRVLQKKDLA